MCHLQGHAVIRTHNLGAVQASRRGMICNYAKHNDVDWWELTWQQLHVNEEQGVKGIETHFTKKQLSKRTHTQKYKTDGNDNANELNDDRTSCEERTRSLIEWIRHLMMRHMEEFRKCI